MKTAEAFPQNATQAREAQAAFEAKAHENNLAMLRYLMAVMGAASVELDFPGPGRRAVGHIIRFRDAEGEPLHQLTDKRRDLLRVFVETRGFPQPPLQIAAQPATCQEIATHVAAAYVTDDQVRTWTDGVGRIRIPLDGEVTTRIAGPLMGSDSVDQMQTELRRRIICPDEASMKELDREQGREALAINLETLSRLINTSGAHEAVLRIEEDQHGEYLAGARLLRDDGGPVEPAFETVGVVGTATSASGHNTREGENVFTTFAAEMDLRPGNLNALCEALAFQILDTRGILDARDGPHTGPKGEIRLRWDSLEPQVAVEMVPIDYDQDGPSL